MVLFAVDVDGYTYKACNGVLFVVDVDGYTYKASNRVLFVVDVDGYTYKASDRVLLVVDVDGYTHKASNGDIVFYNAMTNTSQTIMEASEFVCNVYLNISQMHSFILLVCCLYKHVLLSPSLFDQLFHKVAYTRTSVGIFQGEVRHFDA